MTYIRIGSQIRFGSERILNAVQIPELIDTRLSVMYFGF